MKSSVKNSGRRAFGLNLSKGDRNVCDAVKAKPARQIRTKFILIC
jgi:hypothetical protein